MDIAIAVGARIRTLREEKGLSQDQLAALAGITGKHLSVLERGGKNMCTTTLVALANALEVSTDALLIDVVDYAVMSQTSELYMLISKEPVRKQKDIINAFKKFLELLNK